MILSKKEILRYLGHRNTEVTKSIDNIIEECISEISNMLKYSYTYGIFDIIKKDSDIQVLGSTLILRGKDINKHLKDSSKCAIMAVTLGNAVDSRIRYYEKTDLTKSLIFDATATTAIEGVCDECEALIKTEAEGKGYGTTYRYSPGYGDLSINIQAEVLRILGAEKKIGLTATANSILLPRKSVTAIIGFQDKNIKKQHPGCGACKNYVTCNFRKGGDYCEN